MADKKHVVVVCGYGCHLEDVEGKDTPLKPYLHRLIKFISNESPDFLIFCGGFTQHKTAPGVSEAGLMHDYTDAKNISPNLRVLREKDSFTSFENIKNAAKLIKLGQVFILGPKVRITIFCEATRSANVVMLARHFMKDLVDTVDDITVETASWERADPFKQAGNLIYNKLAITFPWLGLAEREHRRRIRRSEHI